MTTAVCRPIKGGPFGTFKLPRLTWYAGPVVFPVPPTPVPTVTFVLCAPNCCAEEGTRRVLLAAVSMTKVAVPPFNLEVKMCYENECTEATGYA